ncbi:hypothetical protein BDW69DRAFT_12859 [Aspergillus filifer]
MLLTLPGLVCFGIRILARFACCIDSLAFWMVLWRFSLSLSLSLFLPSASGVSQIGLYQQTDTSNIYLYPRTHSSFNTHLDWQCLLDS